MKNEQLTLDIYLRDLLLEKYDMLTLNRIINRKDFATEAEMKYWRDEAKEVVTMLNDLPYPPVKRPLVIGENIESPETITEAKRRKKECDRLAYEYAEIRWIIRETKDEEKIALLIQKRDSVRKKLIDAEDNYTLLLQKRVWEVIAKREELGMPEISY